MSGFLTLTDKCCHISPLGRQMKAITDFKNLKKCHKYASTNHSIRPYALPNSLLIYIATVYMLTLSSAPTYE